MSIPTISQRGLDTPASPIRKLAPFAAQAKQNGTHVYHLNIGQPDIPTPPEYYAAISRFGEKVLAYNPSDGLLTFRQCLIQYYQRVGYKHLGVEDLMVTTGGSEAILFTMMAVASPGDEILVFEPFYPNYNGFAHMAGIRLTPVGTDPGTGYHLPQTAQIEQKINKKTKAILLNSPSNPTGTILTRDELRMISDMALKHDLFILSDEVYREFAFENEHTSVLSIPEISQHAVVMDSLSKRYSACGARIGCIVSKNIRIMETVLKFGQARLCPPTLEQVGSTALVDEGDKYFVEMIEEYNNRRNVIYEGLTNIPGVSCKKPEGAFYLMVTFPVEDIEDFARWILTDFHLDGATTMMAPGPGFYATPGKGKKEARIAYVLNTEDLKKAVAVLEEGLSIYNKSA